VIAAVPQIVTDGGSIAAALVAVAGAIVILWRTPPIRKVNDLLRAERRRDFMVGVTEGTDDLRVSLAEHRHLITYHLGENHGTRPLQDRVTQIERQVLSIVGEQVVVREELHDERDAAPRLVERVENIEHHVESIAGEQEQVRHDLEEV